MRVTRSRWIAAVAIPAAVVAGVVVIPAAANADPTLPTLSAQDLLELVAASSDVAYSGTIEQTSDLGLPDLGAFGPASGSSDGDANAAAMELLTASHTAEVYTDGVDSTRVQVLDRLAERNIVRDGSEVWVYDSESGDATHVTLPDRADGADDARMPVSAPTPAEFAQHLLASIDTSTDVSVTGTARVAGRAAYELTLTPRTTETLVDTVSMSVDAETGLPLSARITADDQDAPAFSIALTSVSFDTPDPSVFDFTPPASATVIENDLSAGRPAPEAPSAGSDVDPLSTPGPAVGSESGATMIGEGWGAIMSFPAAPAGASASSSESPASSSEGSGVSSEGSALDAAAMLDRITTPVLGGRALETALVSVLITDDGRVFAGAVPVASLQTAAAATATAAE